MKPIAGARLEPVLSGFAYQLQAVEAVKQLPYAALFHEQGLGKTKVGIDLALEWLRQDAVDCVIFVTKRGLVPNWQDELRMHSHMKPVVLTQDHRANFFAFNSTAQFLVTHYEVMRSELRRLRLFLGTRRVGVILDEAHKIKNPDAEVARALHTLAPKFVRRVIMTGTPVANRPYDLWSQIFFLDQGESLGTSFKTFKQGLDLTNELWKCPELQSAFEESIDSLFDKVRRFSVRETKATAGIDLPEKRIENLMVTLAPKQRELYEQIRREMHALVTRDQLLVRDDSEEALKRLLRLVQTASNPRLVDEAYDEEPGKVAVARDLVARAVAQDSKVIVWTNFIDNVGWLASLLAEYHPVFVHGEVPMAARTDALNRFKTNPSCRVLIATPGAAKEGLTLTVANHAIFFDRSFSLDDYLQAQDRIHRISQQRTCFVWNLVGAGTVDEWVDSLLAAKRLAAQLAQGDIEVDEYRERADYDFGRMIREILEGHSIDG